MSRSTEILRDHYLRLARKIATWTGVVAVITSVLVPAGANASVGQLSPRKAALTTSSPAVGLQNITFTFNPSVTNSGTTIKAIGFQLCGTSPLDGGSCTVLSSSTMAAATFSTGSGGNTAPFTSNWAIGTAGDCGARTTTYACIFYTTGNALSAATSYSVVIGGIQIPEVANTELYTRITTYTAYAAGTPSGETDFGGQALSTSTVMSESATVQESLVFALGQSGTTCANVAGGGTVAMSNSTPMSTTTDTYSATPGKMCANTNASSGYSITYAGTTFSAAGGSTFTSPVTQFTAVAGTANFGFNMRANTSPQSYGSNVSGGGGTCTNVDYCTVNKFSYDGSGTVVTVANSGGAPSADSIYTISYIAEIDNTIKTGVYTATQTFIATGTF